MSKLLLKRIRFIRSFFESYKDLILENKEKTELIRYENFLNDLEHFLNELKKLYEVR